MDEGLCMERHPGIAFRTGPGGRRPGLVRGPDVWEVIRVYNGVEAHGEQALQQTAELTDLVPEHISIAVRYYTEHRDEIDAWIRRIDDEAVRAEAAWRRGRQLPGA